MLSAIREEPRSRRHSGGVLEFPALARALTRPRLRLAAAAVAVLVAGLIIQSRSASPPGLPSAPTGDVTRGGRIEIFEPMGEISRPPAIFRWQAESGAARYLVTVTSVDDSIVWQGESASDQIELPEEVGSALRSAVVYFWQVEALNRDESRIAWSAPTRFLINGTHTGEAK